MTALDLSRWVPHPSRSWREQADSLADALRGRQVCLLTGAGCSTESGIPDYRGEETARRARNPIRFQQFVDEPLGRARYWARSMLGWPRFRAAQPNAGHRAAAALEWSGVAQGIITQNVDRLHHRAGSRGVVELHGALEEVVCLECTRIEHRDDLQARLESENPAWLDRFCDLAPDGDADIAEAHLRDFRVVGCQCCGGVLKPRVVFFGEAVPKDTVDAAWDLLDASDALLVAGSSLAVFSGYRFVRRAVQEQKPVYVVNVGPTRADPLATLRVSGNVGDVLAHLAKALVDQRF